MVFQYEKEKLQQRYLGASKNLGRLIAPFDDQGNRLKELRAIMERGNLQAHVTCFWRGPPSAHPPSIWPIATPTLRRLPADIQPDFATEWTNLLADR